MKSGASRQGSALILTLLLLALMLTLVLYYVSLVRLETQTAGFSQSQYFSEEAMDLAVAEAMAAVEAQHRLRADERKNYLSVTGLTALVSSGNGGAVSGQLTRVEVEALAWPEPDAVLAQAERAEWVIRGDRNQLHQAYAWAVLPLTGMLDPEGLAGWNAAHLGFTDTRTSDRVYFSPQEVREGYPDAEPYFLPGMLSQDRGWYDYSRSSWQTNVVVGAETLSMNPLSWTDIQIDAAFQELYPDQDHAALAGAFRDFISGNIDPTDPEAITAVPVPLFNEVKTTLTLRNLGNDLVEISHQVDLEIWNLYVENENLNQYKVAQTPALSARNSTASLVAWPGTTADETWEFPAPSGEVDQAFAILTYIQSPRQHAYVAGDVLEVDVELGGLSLSRIGGGVVDRLPAGLKLEMPPLTVPGVGEEITVAASLEAVDPGLNHLSEQWLFQTVDSIGEVNQAAKDAAGSDIKSDAWQRWTPAGRRGEWEEGWIGFLPLDLPWRSVDLFDESGQWWLRYTRPPDWEAGFWNRNQLNPNALYVESLAAVFVDLPFSSSPDTAVPGTLTLDQARRVAAELTAAMQLDEGAVERGGWSTAMENVLMDAFSDRHQAESVVANSLARMQTGYQVYGVILWSETRFTSGQKRAKQREILVLWVDPTPDETGRHAIQKILRTPFG